MNLPEPIVRNLRWYDGIAAIVVVTLVGLTFLNLQSYRQRAEPQSPLSYSVPQPIIGPKTVPVGGILTVSRIKCNTSGEPIALQGQGSFYRRIDHGGEYQISNQSGNILVIQANSCDSATFSAEIPLTVSPGVWVRQGIDCTVDRVIRFCASWVTEQFTVVAP